MARARTSTSPGARRNGLIVTAITVTIVIVLGGGVLWYLFLWEEGGLQGHTDRLTLVAPAVPVGSPFHSEEPELLTSLAMTGGRPEDAAFEISLIQPDGGALPADSSYHLSAELANLNDGAFVERLPVEAVAGASTPTWTVTDPGVASEGWWRIRTVAERPDGDPVQSEFHLLMPDPNMAGVTAPPSPGTDPAAATMLDVALTAMSRWTSVRWWQWLSGGDGSMILIEFSVTTPHANGEPPGFRNRSLYAGRPVPDAAGNPPASPRVNYFTSVTIGEEAWQVQEGGTPESRPPTQYLPIGEYPKTYEGAANVRFGITEQVDGRAAQVVTFHVPTLPTQSEAWYAFWIDVETGEVLRLSMIAMNHYMVWEYFDVNEPFVLEFPSGRPKASPASVPAATPVP